MSEPQPNASRHPDCCAGEHDTAPPLSVAEGRQRILEQVPALEAWEQLPVPQALGRVLAEPVISPIDVPAYRNSAMDGYAVRSSDLPEGDEGCLRVVGSVLAGHPFQGSLKAGECVEIMTGAAMPAEADTVIIKEVVRREGDRLFFPAGAKPGQNQRQAGEDLARGSRVLAAGQQIGPAELGLLASLGQGQVRVLRKLRVACFSTGDEIRSLGETLQAGQLYDSNRYTLSGLLSSLPVERIDLGVIPDRPEAIEAAFRHASAQADVVISSGGVSLGEADFVKSTLDRLGQVDFWRLAIKPGRPLAFGRVGDALFFGLPGNPVAVMITFLQFVKPALLKQAGVSDWLPLELSVPAGERLRKRPGRTEYVRGILRRSAAGGLEVVSTGNQGSGILTSMSRANCLVVLAEASGDIEPGMPVSVQPFTGLL